jgi:hypothetical protein
MVCGEQQASLSAPREADDDRSGVCVASITASASAANSRSA